MITIKINKSDKTDRITFKNCMSAAQNKANYMTAC